MSGSEQHSSVLFLEFSQDHEFEYSKLQNSKPSGALNFAFDTPKISNSETNKPYCDTKTLAYPNNKVKRSDEELCCVPVKLPLKLNMARVHTAAVVKFTDYVLINSERKPMLLLPLICRLTNFTHK